FEGHCLCDVEILLVRVEVMELQTHNIGFATDTASKPLLDLVGALPKHPPPFQSLFPSDCAVFFCVSLVVKAGPCRATLATDLLQPVFAECSSIEVGWWFADVTGAASLQPVAHPEAREERNREKCLSAPGGD